MALHDFVRVRAENGQLVSMPRHRADALGLKPLKRPALTRDGRVAPPKNRVPLGGKAGTAANPSNSNPTPEADASEVD